MNLLHNRKKLTIAIFVACFAALSARASAEQPKAEEYRALFASGNFCVKYGVGQISRNILTPGTESGFGKTSTAERYKAVKVYMITAENGNWRMKGIYGNGEHIIGINGEFIKKMNKKKTAPDVLYKDGKYYRTTSDANTDYGGVLMFTWSKTTFKSTALMLSEENLGLSSLDPSEGWGHIRKDLALPDELAVFRWDDPYRDVEGKTEAPHFIGSAKRKVNEKTYDCDDYAIEKKAVSGAILSQDIWRTFYEGGNLAYVQRLFVRDGKEELISMIDIRDISSTAPAALFELPKGTLVYAADEGKMYDLTEQGLLIEKVGEVSQDKRKSTSSYSGEEN